MHWLDPDHLPETRGTISSLVFNEHGEVDGLVMKEGPTVHMAPHLGARVVRSIHVGDEVALRGVKPKGAATLVVLRITTTDGKVFSDDGPVERPPAKLPARKPMHVEGVVKTTIHAPKGEVSGAVLQSGEVIRMHPKGNEGLAEYLRPEAHVEVWGEGFVKNGTRVIELGEIAFVEGSDEVDEAAE
jgi:hypothetical protein